MGESKSEPSVSVNGLVKIFGRRVKRSLKFLRDGKTKDEIQKMTGATVGVYDASFDIYPEETFIVMGLSGSGKSTLVRCVIRLIEPTAGTIILNGQDVTKMGERELMALRRKDVGMVFQHFALFPHRTVLDNVAYGLEIQGISKRERYTKAEEYLEQVGLGGWGHYRPKALSGGMQQRVGLARALIQDPAILLMDEPFSALDPLIRKDMQDELVDMQRKMRKSILFITHDLDEALRLGDRIAIMNEGQVVQIGTPKEIVTEPVNDYVAEFVQNVDRFDFLTAKDAIGPNIPLLRQDQPVADAWKAIEDSQSPYLVQTDGDNRLVGITYSHDVKAALQNGPVNLDQLPVHESEVASPNILASDLLPRMSANYQPIVLLDDSRRIVGVVDASSLVASLVDSSDED